MFHVHSATGSSFLCIRWSAKRRNKKKKNSHSEWSIAKHLWQFTCLKLHMNRNLWTSMKSYILHRKRANTNHTWCEWSFGFIGDIYVHKMYTYKAITYHFSKSVYFLLFLVSIASSLSSFLFLTKIGRLHHNLQALSMWCRIENTNHFFNEQFQQINLLSWLISHHFYFSIHSFWSVDGMFIYLFLFFSIEILQIQFILLKMHKTFFSTDTSVHNREISKWFLNQT